MSKTDVRMLADGCPVGQTRANVVCPFCGGGRTNERTFSVTRDCHGILYNCYRASCGARGFVRDGAGAIQGLPTKVEQSFKPRPYHGYTLPLSEQDYDFFNKAFQLDAATIDGSIFVSERGEYVLPVRDARANISAYMVRRDSWARDDRPKPPRPCSMGTQSPKSYVFRHTDRPVQAFYRSIYATERLVIVEDQLSAMRVAQDGLDSVALLGTTLNAERVREIASLQPTEVVIALDADATDKAFELARDWGMAFNKTRVAILERDLKDTGRVDVLPALGVTT